MLEPITQSRSELLDPPSTLLVEDAPASTNGSEQPSDDPMRQAISYLDSARTALHPGHPDEADRILDLLRLAAAHLELALAPRDGLRLPASLQGAE